MTKRIIIVVRHSGSENGTTLVHRVTCPPNQLRVDTVHNRHVDPCRKEEPLGTKEVGIFS